MFLTKFKACFWAIFIILNVKNSIIEIIKEIYYNKYNKTLKGCAYMDKLLPYHGSTDIVEGPMADDTIWNFVNEL